MRDLLTGEDLFAHILMLRTHDHRTLLLLEGDADCAALDPHIDEEHCHSLPGHGRVAVQRTVELVDATATQRVLAIVDRDWAGLLYPEPQSPNLVITDDYDLDATIFFISGIGERVVANFCDREAVQRNVTAGASAVVELVASHASQIGVLRYVSEREGWELRLRDLPIGEALSANGLEVDLDRLIMLGVRRATAPRVSEADAKSTVVDELAKGVGGQRYCAGHDIGNALAALGRRRLGARGGADAIKAAMRTALGCAELKRTALYRAVAEWATSERTVVWSCS